MRACMRTSPRRARLRHVRAHLEIAGNEAADALAKAAARGEIDETDEAAWLAMATKVYNEHGGQGGAPSSSADRSPPPNADLELSATTASQPAQHR